MVDYGDFAELRPLQQKILDIMKFIDELCTKHNIEYFLMGGSALGAVRHKGFIPWDDDLDIFMTPNNFDKFVIALDSEQNNSYYLQITGKHKNYYSVPKLRLNNSTYIEEIVEHWDLHHGVYVDIFILHNASNNIIYRKLQYFMSKLLVIKSLSLKKYKSQGIYRLAMMLIKLIPAYLIKEITYPIIFHNRNKSTTYKCNFLGKARYKKGLYDSKWFTSYKYTEFEDTNLRVSEHVEDFLKERFGDYMKMPSLKDIKKEQHAKQWSLNSEINWYSKPLYRDEKYLI